MAPERALASLVAVAILGSAAAGRAEEEAAPFVPATAVPHELDVRMQLLREIPWVDPRTTQQIPIYNELGALVAAATDASNQRRSDSGMLTARDLAIGLAAVDFDSDFFESIRETLRASSWMEVRRFGAGDQVEPVISFDTRDRPMVVVSTDVRTDAWARMMVMETEVSYYRRGDLAPSFEITLQYGAKAPGDPTELGRPPDVPFWSAAGGRAYAAMIDDATQATTEMLRWSLSDPQQMPEDGAETSVEGETMVEIRAEGDRHVLRTGEGDLLSIPSTGVVRSDLASLGLVSGSKSQPSSLKRRKGR